MVFLDVGPNLGAITRAALLAADCVLIPLAGDLFGLRGLRNAGPVVRKRRASWRENVLPKAAGLELDVPHGGMEPMIDIGLAELARHARDRGHGALILFLDELILWLGSGEALRAQPPGRSPRRSGVVRRGSCSES